MSDQASDQAVIDQAAAEWVLRGLAPDLCDQDLIELTLWLETSEHHAAAYDRALRLWAHIDALAAPSEVRPTADVINLTHHRLARSATKTFKPATYWAWAGGAAAAVAALLIVFVLPQQPAQTYQTAKGQKQTVTLADGSVLSLNTNTRVSVQLRHDGRRITLEQGELALKVVHDDKRPMVLKTGDMVITDIGTEFNVRREAGVVDVAVREGEVSINSGDIHLRRGDKIVHTEGDTASTLSHVDPDEAFAWQTAHAIYRNAPLSEVVKDLNRYYDKPFVVDDQSGKLRLTAILTLDSESAVAERLEDFLPVKARATDRAIYLGQPQPDLRAHRP